MPNIVDLIYKAAEEQKLQKKNKPKKSKSEPKQVEAKDLQTAANICVYLSGNPNPVQVLFTDKGQAEDAFDALSSWLDAKDLDQQFTIAGPTASLLLNNYHAVEAALLVMTETNSHLVASAQKLINNLMMQQ